MVADNVPGGRERRPAVWPWLVMPLIVLLVYYALLKVHQRPGPEPANAPSPSPPAAQRTPLGQ
jgi:hypothetical protein